MRSPTSIQPSVKSLKESFDSLRMAVESGLRAAGTISEDDGRIEGARRRGEALTLVGPRIGGSDFVPIDRRLFLSAEFRKRYVPGEQRGCYAARCRAADSLGEQIGLPLRKVSTSTPDRISVRIDESCRDAYASGYRSNGALISNPADLWAWEQIVIRSKAGLVSGSPVYIDTGMINVRLPARLSRETFDRCFDFETRKAAIDLWIETPQGAARCAARKIDPDLFRRWTVYANTKAMAPTSVRELIVFREDVDVDRIIAIIERIILRHLGLVA